MFKRVVPWARICITGLIALAAAMVASAEDSKTLPPRSVSDETLGADLVRTGLYLITGGGSNSLLRLNASGSILVDGKSPGNYRALMSQVRRISKLSDLPARVLIVTDHHDHHTGNHAQFVTAGIAVIAQENAKRRLPVVPANPASGAKPPAPTVTFEREYKLRMGGVEVHLFHFGSAHTDDDAVVHFPDLKVVAVGDLFTPDTPLPDFAGGGSWVGWAPVLDDVLKLDFDIAVPSVGPVVHRAELIAFKTKIETLVSRATALVKQGVPREQLLMQLKTDDLGWRFTLTADQLDGMYADLSQSR